MTDKEAETTGQGNPPIFDGYGHMFFARTGQLPVSITARPGRGDDPEILDNHPIELHHAIPSDYGIRLKPDAPHILQFKEERNARLRWVRHVALESFTGLGTNKVDFNTPTGVKDTVYLPVGLRALTHESKHRLYFGASGYIIPSISRLSSGSEVFIEVSLWWPPGNSLPAGSRVRLGFAS